MPPAPPDTPVGRARGPVGALRRIRRTRRAPEPGSPASVPDPERSSALEALLADLGSRIRHGPALSRDRDAAGSARFCPTGLSPLDAALGGGFPQGHLCEIHGAASSGRTTLALRLLSETLKRGVLGAWIDLADSFDPASAAASGCDLERLLWVRARSGEQVLRSCERLLRAEGFGLIIVDLALSPGALPGPPDPGSFRPTRSPTPRPPRPRVTIRDVGWLRLARLAAGSRTTLVALSDFPMTGSHAGLVLEMEPLGARFSDPPLPALLEGLETTAILRRHRHRPTGQTIPFSIGTRSGTIRVEPIRPSPRRRRG
ncbi:MAG TPA: hypothetical protein ENI85_11870 [Deltaproteobacteria bacterium]|nr:hypothetical protein [Deltaproteobacteria bacterium]